MLIIDTNALTRQGAGNPLWEQLYALKVSGKLTPAITEVVLVELLSQREREYEAAVTKAQDAYDALLALSINDDPGLLHRPAPLPVTDHVQAWEQLYRRTLKVLPLKLEAAREGLRREAYRVLPARPSGKTATGSRDSAIWMTVLEQAQLIKPEPVIFVSENRNDFGTGGKLFPRMAAEVAAAGAKVEYLNSLDDVLARFAQLTPLHDDSDLRARIMSPSTQSWLHQYVVSQLTGEQFAGSVVDFDDHGAPFMEWGHFTDWLLPPDIKVLSWTDAAQYVMGSSSTRAVTVHVLVTGLANRVRNYETEPELTAFTADIRLLFGTDSVTALSAGTPQPIADDDNAEAIKLAWKMADRTRSSSFPSR